MNAIFIRAYQKKDVPAMTTIWNEVVQDGIAFPQEEFLTEETAADFFAQQTACGVAEDPATGSILGLYILHPNNIGRCGHICNTSYAVSSQSRGQHIGEKHMDSAFCSSMPLWQPIPTHGIFMNELDFSRLAVFQTVFA